MRIVILGASRGTGALAAREAVERGHTVTAFARHPEKLAFDHPKLSRIQGDFHDRASVEGAVRDQDAVLVTASAASLRAFRENPAYFSQGTALAVDAMRTHGVRKLVVLSAIGTGESRRLLPSIVSAVLVGFVLKVPFEDHERQEGLVRASGLDWVIVRPGRLTNGPARRRYVIKTTIERVPSSISRADVAAFMVAAAETDTWNGHAVQIGG